MNFEAIILLIVSMVTLWGGLALAVANLMRHPDLTQEEE